MTYIHNTAVNQGIYRFAGQTSIMAMWHETSFEVRGVPFVSVGQYLAWKKAQYWGATALAEAIYEAETTEEAMRIKTKLTVPDSNQWALIAPAVALEGLVHRLKADPEAAAYLLQTDDALLVEVNPFDEFWASGLDAYDTRLATSPPDAWPGRNTWGQLLVEARTTIRNCLNVAG